MEINKIDPGFLIKKEKKIKIYENASKNKKKIKNYSTEFLTIIGAIQWHCLTEACARIGQPTQSIHPLPTQTIK